MYILPKTKLLISVTFELCTFVLGPLDKGTGRI